MMSRPPAARSIVYDDLLASSAGNSLPSNRPPLASSKTSARTCGELCEKMRSVPIVAAICATDDGRHKIQRDCKLQIGDFATLIAKPASTFYYNVCIDPVSRPVLSIFRVR